jgi:hypothetical protein
MAAMVAAAAADLSEELCISNLMLQSAGPDALASGSIWCRAGTGDCFPLRRLSRA